MHSSSNCLVKREVFTPVIIVFSIVSALLVAFGIGITLVDFLWTLLLFFIGALIISTLHELVHYVAIRMFAKQPVDLVFYPKYCSIVVIYRELLWNQYIVVALSPQLLIELPLLLIYLLTRDTVVLLVFIYHTFASLPDIVLSIRCLLVFRKCMLRMYVENNRIRGYYVIKPNGDCTLYLF